MISPTRKTLTACYSALWRGLRSCTPQIELDEKGYVAKVAENLVDRVSLGDFEPNLRSGDGNELAKKFRAAHSSAALAVNTFAPFKPNPTALRRLADGGFASLLL